MATTYPDHYTTQFDSSWQHLFQQEMSRLKQYVRTDSITGKEKKYNQMGLSTARLIDTRNGVTEPDNVALDARWIRLKAYDMVEWLDEWDEKLLGEVSSPTSDVAKSHAMGFGRRCDDTLIEALEGSNYTGADGTTSTALPAGQIVTSGGGGADLTLSKLIQAKELFWANEAYDEKRGDQLCIAVGSYQLRTLLEDVNEVKSTDYNDVHALVKGLVDEFMGFRFIRTERLTVSSNIRQCLAWVKSNVILGISADKSTKISIRDDRNETLQIRSKMMLGATRLQEEAVVRIDCDETA